MRVEHENAWKSRSTTTLAFAWRRRITSVLRVQFGKTCPGNCRAAAWDGVGTAVRAARVGDTSGKNIKPRAPGLSVSVYNRSGFNNNSNIQTVSSSRKTCPLNIAFSYSERPFIKKTSDHEIVPSEYINMILIILKCKSFPLRSAIIVDFHRIRLTESSSVTKWIRPSYYYCYLYTCFRRCS